MNENFNDILSNFSEILKEKDIDLNNIINKNNEESNNDQNNSNNQNDFLDINMILKIKDLMSKMNNQNNSRNQLLYSLKPYLEDTKKEKLEQYIKIANLLTVLESLDDKNSFKNSFKFLFDNNNDFVLMLILFLLII